MKEILFSAQEKLDLRKSFLGVIWGFSLVFFQIGDDATFGEGPEWPISIVAFIFAGLLIFKPQKDWVWLGLGLLLPVQILFLLPAVKNHSLFFAAFAVALTVSYLTSRLSRKRDATNWLTDNEPFLRLVFLLGYGAAAIAKLNSDFFNYQISCANSMAVEGFAWLPVKIPFESFTWLPAAVAGTELFVFIGLMFAKTRPWALIVAVAFHFALSLYVQSAAIAFNPALYSLLALFLPPEANEYLAVKWRRVTHRLGQTVMQTLRVLLVVGLIAILAFFKFQQAGPFMLWPSFLLRMVYSVVMVAMIAFCAYRFRKSALGAKTVSVPNLTSWVVVIIMVLNAASPYLGGKTGSTFTMFSNLRVEGGVSNHFFLPRLPIESAQDDLVKVLDSSNRQLKSIAAENLLVTWFSFQKIALNAPDDWVIYERAGQQFSVDKISESDVLVGYSPFWAGVLYFRQVPIAGTCVW